MLPLARERAVNLRDSSAPRLKGGATVAADIHEDNAATCAVDRESSETVRVAPERGDEPVRTTQRWVESGRNDRSGPKGLVTELQIFKKTIQVSGTQEVVDKAGRDSEIAYQLMKRGKEIKRDIERALTQNQAGTGGATAVARSLGSVESWLSSNWTSKGSGSPVHTGFDGTIINSPTDATTTGSFSEANLKAMIKEAWSSGGNPTVVMCGPTAKQKISSFAGIGTQFRDVGGKTAASNRIVGAADIYISDFGEHRIVPNRFQRDRTVLLLDMDYWAVAVLRGMTKEKLAKTGDAEKWHLVTELTLESRQEKASAKIVDVDGTL